MDSDTFIGVVTAGSSLFLTGFVCRWVFSLLIRASKSGS